MFMIESGAVFYRAQMLWISVNRSASSAAPKAAAKNELGKIYIKRRMVVHGIRTIYTGGSQMRLLHAISHSCGFPNVFALLASASFG
jgi:hypothetical protein